MKPFLNWIILTALLVGALGFSPQTQNITVTAQSAEPPSSSESPEPLILPFVPDETAEPSQSLAAADPAATEPPPPAPFSIHLDTSCDAWGQTARLSWSLTGELADSLGDKSELLLKLPAGLQPLEGMEIAPDGTLHLPASPEGQALFNIQPEASETGQLEARLLTADAGQAAARVDFTPGAYARLTPEGGLVEAAALGISLEIPPGSLAAETALCISPLSEAELPTTLSGRPFQVNAYDLETGEEITRFDQYLTVRVHYNPETYTTTASQLKLFYFSRELQDWSALPSEVDEESHTLSGYTDHFTPFDIKPQSWESARLPNLDGFAVSEFIGAATYTYPIQLPAGAGGWQPSLALTYNSQVVDNANSITQASWAGMGWSLDTGYIQRNMGENVSYYGPQDPNGSDADIRLDDDTGHDGDDTFSLVLNGQSWRLLRLPDQDNNSETIDYRTENESFWRIRHNHAHITSGYVTDNSTWEVWDKTGNHYTFSPEARYPVGCYSPFLLAWQWPLTSATNAHSQTISYTYSTETEVRSATSSPSCDAAYTQVAVYPATITYSGYQVVFDRSARYDHKAAWDTDPDSRWQTIFFQRSRLAAIRILSQNGSNWELVRKYTLTQQDGVIFPNLLWNTSVPGSKTPTLTGITEYGSDGATALPATTFTYDDDMHLVTGSNGYGGSVTFDYAPPWYEFQTSQDPIREYSNTQNQNLPITASIGGTLDVYDPGQMYKIELKVWPTTAVCTAGYYYTVSGSTTWVPGTLLEEETPSGATYKYMRWASFYSLLNPAPRFYFSCTGGGYLGQVKPYYAKVWPLVNRYRVTAQTSAENHANTSSTTSYTYSGAASNNPANSTPGTYPLSEPRTDYRGHSSVTQVGPQNLAVTTWYGQGDDTTGLPLAQLTALQQVYDDFDTLDTSLWSHSHYGVRQTIVREEGEPLLKMDSGANGPVVDLQTSQAAIQDADSVVVQFKIVEATATAKIYLQSGSLYWGIRIMDDALTSAPAVKMLFDADGDDGNAILMNESQFSLNTWYVLMLTAGAEKFTAHIWQRDNPANFYQYSNAGNPGYSWKSVQSIQNGTLYLEDYRAGPAYGLQLNQYAAPQGYTPPSIVPPYLYPGNQAYTDLAVRWLPLLQSTSYSLGESGRFTGTRQTYQYDPAYQGNTQYGNQTHVIEAVWTQATPPTWSNYRMTLTGYYPNVSLTNPVKNLVGLPGFSNRYQCENATACTAANPRLLGSSWYLYDSHTGYNQPPTTGALTGQRSLLYWGNPATPSDPYYLDQDYTYDGYGNLAAQVVYNSPGSFSSRATTNPHKTETLYDSQHHAFPIETRAYYNATQYYATTYGYDNNDGNIRSGLLTRLSDPNGAITTAGYDVFGRITSIVRPGDSSGTPTLRFSYNLDGANHLFWTQAEQLISGTTYYKARKFYNGLGQLVQSQEDATVGGTLQTVVTDTEYNNLGLVEKQYLPYAVGLTGGFVTPAGQFFTQTAYDDLGRVNVITQPDATTTVLNYNIHLLNGQPASVTYSWDANVNVSEAWADAFGRLVKSQGATGPAVTYTYDPADRLTSALYGSAQTSITYDIAGRKLTLDDPDMGLWTYAYDTLSNLTRQVDARGQRICLYYDGLNRLTGKHYRADDACPSSPTFNVTYGYDAGTYGKLQRTSMTDASGSTSWSYTARGLLETETKTITGAGAFATKYTYNSADLPTNMQYPADNAGNLTGLPSLTYTYHPQMTLDTLGSYVTGTTYDAAGRITARSLGNGTAISNTYNLWTVQGGRLSNINSVQSGTTRQNLSYTYDAVGNITQIADALGLTTNYTYDSLNRLDSASETTNNNPEYDAQTGNLLNLNGSQQTTAYGYNDVNHLHAVTHIGGTLKYVYDLNGNMTQRPNQTLQYNAENQLTAVTGTPSATFVYDGDGNRVLTTVNGVTIAYIGGHTEWNVTAQELTRYYLAGGQRVAFRVIKSGQADKVFYLLADHLGSTNVVMHVGGGVETKTYTAWGKDRTGSITKTDRQYTGQINESEIGLYFYNARYYDSYLGRFISADTIVPGVGEGGNPDAVGYLGFTTYSPLVVDFHEVKFLEQVNEENQRRLQENDFNLPPVPGNSIAFDRYAYSLNNPLRYTDPTGHCPLCVAIALTFSSITPIGWVAIGVITVGIVVYYAAGGPEAVANGINQASEAASNGLQTLFAKGEYVPPGLSGQDRKTYRDAVHRYKRIWGLGGSDKVDKEILDAIAEAVKQGAKAVDAAESVDSPQED